MDKKKPVETIGSQVVLAGKEQEHKSIGNFGPGTGGLPEKKELSQRLILELVDKVAAHERLDPLLPSAKCLHKRKTKKQLSINDSYEVSLLNAIVILAVIYLFYLFFREEKNIKKQA